MSWIKLHKSIVNWEWASYPEMVSLWIHFLASANYEDSSWKGIQIKRGQLIFGRNEWSKKTGITPQRLRTCIERLKSTNEITIKSTNKYSIITIENYEKYQSMDVASTIKSTSKSTNEQPAINQQATTLIEYKNIRIKEDKFILPDWIPQKDWDDWLAARPKKATDRAKELALKKLDELRKQGHPPDVVLQHCIMNGYQGIFPPSEKKAAFKTISRSGAITL